MDVKNYRNKAREHDQLRIKPDILLRAITDKQLSKAELQRKSQVSIPTINKMLRGEAVRPVIVGRIAHYLKVSIDDLIEEWDHCEKLE